MAGRQQQVVAVLALKEAGLGVVAGHSGLASVNGPVTVMFLKWWRARVRGLSDVKKTTRRWGGGRVCVGSYP
ncbi:hypothetical protein ACFUTV_38560 [Streptomyces sp. NPDC057298]|uniref:hypothetical protein n=1 Tax=Streptomyces sp. NPDC057298 TaxID=3346091 RepID=UPI00363FD279